MAPTIPLIPPQARQQSKPVAARTASRHQPIRHQANPYAINHASRAWSLLEDGFDGQRWPGEPKDAEEAARLHLVAALEAMDGKTNGRAKPSKPTDDVRRTVLKMLEDGPRESREVLRTLKIHPRAFTRLRQRLGLVAIRRGFGRCGAWFLSLPKKADAKI